MISTTKIIIVAIVVAVLASVVMILVALKQKKLEEERQVRIDQNVLVVRNKINKYKNQLNEKGIQSITKNKIQNDLLPKNDILFSVIELEFIKQKILNSGKIKETLDGFGDTLISDKAITTRSNLVSGKRRYLYKNLIYQDLIVERTEFGNSISFRYNNASIIMNCNQEQLEAIITAFYLKDNPIKEKNSISF